MAEGHTSETRNHRRAGGVPWVGVLICVVVGWLSAFELRGEDPASGPFTVRSWERVEGLPMAPIRALAHTPDGYLWIGTMAGLARFDGARFTTFRTNSVPTLGDDRVTALLACDSGELWVGTAGGTLSRYESGVFVPMQTDPRMRGDRVSALVRDSQGVLWGALVREGLMRCRGGRCELVAVPANPGRDSWSMTADQDGRVWAASPLRLFVLEGGEWVDRPELQPPSMPAVVLAPARGGGLWIGKCHPQSLWGRGAHVDRIKDGRWFADPGPYPWPQDTRRTAVEDLVEDEFGRLWLSTREAGIFCREPGGAWHRVQEKGPLAEAIGGRLLLDGEGGVWLGTASGELLCVRDHQVTTVGLPAEVSDRAILSSCVSRDGSLWVGTDGGGMFRGVENRFRPYGAAEGLGDLHVNVVFEDQRTNLWVGTQQGLYRRVGDRFEPTPGPQPLRESVMTLGEDRHGNLWVGTFAGVVRLRDQESEVFGAAQGVDHNFLRAIVEDRAGRLWLAITDRGLYRFEDGRFQRFGEGWWPNQESIRTLLADDQGALWVGGSFGLVRLKAGRMTRWTTLDGLPTDHLVSIDEDAAGTLWFGSTHGVFGCSKALLEAYVPGQSPPLMFLRLAAADGMARSGCSGLSQPSVGRGADGSLWFPNGNRMAFLDPRRLRGPGKVRVPVLEEVLVDTHPVARAADGVFRVPPGAQQLEFRYTSPDLSLAQDLRFRFRLQGYDSGWVEAGSRRAAYYTHIAPGRHEFEVEVGTPDGRWLSNSRPVTIEALPFFWQRPLFRYGGFLTLAVVLGLIVWAATQERMRRRLVSLLAQRAVEEERRRISADLHDELGASLTEILLMGELIEQDPRCPEGIRAQTRSINRKTRLVVRGLDEVVWTARPENDSLRSVVDYLSDYAQEFLRASPVRCRLEIAQGLQDLPLSAAVRHHLMLAVKESLHNVVKHSEATEVWLRMGCGPGEFRVSVEDNGRGFDVEARLGAGDGLVNVQRRVESVGGRVEVASCPGHGSTFRLIMPTDSGATLPVQSGR